MYDWRNVRLQLLKTQVVERTLKDGILDPIPVPFHYARNTTQPFWVGDIVGYEIMFSAHRKTQRVVKAV